MKGFNQVSKGAIVFAAGLCLALLAGCSSNNTPTSTSTPSHTTSTPSPSNTGCPPSVCTTPTVDPNTNGIYPASDTAFASASGALKNAWETFSVTIIPGLDNFSQHEKTATVSNKSGGSISDAQAQKIMLADIRTDNLYTWSLAKMQDGLLSQIVNPSTSGGPAIDAMLKGSSVVATDSCIFPNKVTIFNVTPEARQFFSQNGVQLSPQDNVVENFYYNTTCTYTAVSSNGSKQVVATYTGAGNVLVIGHVQLDGTLGSYFYEDNQSSCGNGAPLDLCQS